MYLIRCYSGIFARHHIIWKVNTNTSTFMMMIVMEVMIILTTNKNKLICQNRTGKAWDSKISKLKYDSVKCVVDVCRRQSLRFHHLVTYYRWSTKSITKVQHLTQTHLQKIEHVMQVLKIVTKMSMCSKLWVSIPRRHKLKQVVVIRVKSQIVQKNHTDDNKLLIRVSCFLSNRCQR